MKLEHFHRPGPGTGDLELARAYVPFQQFSTNYSPQEALNKGTYFPELYKPYKRERR